MSVIAWDGKVLAADRQSLRGDTIGSTKKIWSLKNGGAIACAGLLPHGLALKNWVENGMKKEEFPQVNENEKWALLVVVLPGKPVVFYENRPEPIEIFDPFVAWGVGREVALGVMAMGGDAIRAVEIASQFVSGCGNGCDHVCVEKE